MPKTPESARAIASAAQRTSSHPGCKRHSTSGCAPRQTAFSTAKRQSFRNVEPAWSACRVRPQRPCGCAACDGFAGATRDARSGMRRTRTMRSWGTSPSDRNRGSPSPALAPIMMRTCGGSMRKQSKAGPRSSAHRCRSGLVQTVRRVGSSAISWRNSLPPSNASGEMQPRPTATGARTFQGTMESLCAIARARVALGGPAGFASKMVSDVIVLRVRRRAVSAC
jgi:hypothetical protein